MGAGSSAEEHEVRAARVQAASVILNEASKALDRGRRHVGEGHAPACECTDLDYIEPLQLSRHAYDGLRANPRRFAVRRNHVQRYPERVVPEVDGHVVIESVGVRGDVAEAAARAAS